jgi:hypothetical protein
MSREFVDDVRNGKYPVYEGVICKGDGWTSKIKTIQDLDRLRGEYKQRREEENQE